MKKVIIVITILAFFNLSGCYYQEQMNPSKYKYDENEELWLTTKDTTYIFGGKDYHLENDTLFATVSKKMDKQTTLKTNVELPVENIERVEVERTDVLETTLLMISVVVGTLGLIVLIAGASGSCCF
jgi:hypothetical protein